MPPEQAPPARGRIDLRELGAGLAVIVFSLAFAFIGAGYGVGTARQMGAGYFPVALGILGTLLGLGIIIGTLLKPPVEAAPPFEARRLVFVAAAFLIFGLGLEHAGLFLTTILATVVGSLADRTARLKESLLLGAGLALGVWLLFVVLLGLPVPVWPLPR